jgi:DNA-binding NtrC family response regulator/tetratricopeptide (TPR) repeat protein
VRRSAIAKVLSPGEASLAALLGERGGSIRSLSDPAITVFTSALEAMALPAPVIIGEGASPLEPWSALKSVLPKKGMRESEGKVAEQLVSVISAGSSLAVVRRASMFDGHSQAVLRIAIRSESPVRWVLDEDSGNALEIEAAGGSEETRFIALTPSLAFNRELETWASVAAEHEIEELIASLSPSMIRAGANPGGFRASDRLSIAEPRRSYLAALSLLGDRVAESSAAAFLGTIGCRLPIETLMQDAGSIRGSGIEFHPNVFHELRRSLTPGTAAALSQSALDALGDEIDVRTKARLLATGGGKLEAATLLEQSLPPLDERWEHAAIEEEVVAVSRPLRWRRFFERHRDAQYDSAAADARQLEGDDRSFAEALLARRRGNYAAALALVPATDSPAVLTLRGELLRLTNRYDDSRTILDAALKKASTPFEISAAAFALALLDIDENRKADASVAKRLTEVQRARLEAYEHLQSGDYATARKAAEHAMQRSVFLIDRIDAALDLLYALFLEGSWEEARHQARAALDVVEQSEGDRGIAGVLFTLAYLCADAGQWDDAVSMSERLRRHFLQSNDSARLHEVDLLFAQIALTRCELNEAQRRATLVIENVNAPEIVEASRIVLDEVAWCTGVNGPLRSTGRSSCRELVERHALLAIRSGAGASGIASSFHRQLSSFESAALEGRRAKIPEPATTSEKLLLLRSLLGLNARGITRHQENLLELADECGVILPERSGAMQSRLAGQQLDAFVRFASRDFPFDAEPLGLAWRIASCNRLGIWEESGESAPLDDRTREVLLVEPPEDWFAVSERTFFYLPNLSRWDADARSAFLQLIASKIEVHRLRRIVSQEEAAVVPQKIAKIDGIIGESAPMQSLLAMLPRIASRDVAVCILGESGSGKERVASTIHAFSERRSKKFTPVNCAALPDNLIESELFGHVRGAFTGADRDKQGLIDATDGGTLFLDEIGEMPLPAQAKLLRFLQEGEYRRVGDTVNRTADVRIVCATNRKLEQSVDDGRFREDLYYRVRGVELVVPPLRERGSDILLIAKHFLEREAKRHRGGAARLSREVETVFLSYSWPGNVRELENTVRAAHALAGELREIDLEHLPERMRGVVVIRRPTGTFFEEITRFRRDLVEKSLTEAKGNQSHAAKLLGMSRQALAYQIRELGILVK